MAAPGGNKSVIFKAADAPTAWRTQEGPNSSKSEESIVEKSSSKSKATVRPPKPADRASKVLQSDWSADISNESDDSLYSELGNAASTGKSEDQSHESHSIIVKPRSSVTAPKPQTIFSTASASTTMLSASISAPTATATAQAGATSTSPANSASVNAASSASSTTASQIANTEAQEVSWCTRQPHPALDMSTVNDETILHWTNVFLSRPEGSKLEFLSTKKPAWENIRIVNQLTEKGVVCTAGKQVIMSVTHPVTNIEDFGLFCHYLSKSELFTGLHIAGDRTLGTSLGIKNVLVKNPKLVKLELSNVAAEKLHTFFTYLAKTSLTSLTGVVTPTIVHLQTIKLTGCVCSNDKEFNYSLASLAVCQPSLTELDFSGTQISDQHKQALILELRAVGKDHILKF